MRATLHQLRLFEAVARRLSFTRAAEELYLTQPTVSMQIKQLADDIGLPLFEQVGKRISLTDAGRELHETTREIFDGLRRFEMRVADLRGMKQGQLRVGITSSAKYFAPALLGRFIAQYPEVDVRIEIANHERLLERMEANRDDLYVLGALHDDAPVERVKLAENELVAIASRDHPLAAESGIPAARLFGERFLSREPGAGTRTLVARYVAEHGITLHSHMEFDSDEAIRCAVAAGFGVAILSRQALEVDRMREAIAVLDVQGLPIRDAWHVVARNGKKPSVIARSFLDFLDSGGSAGVGRVPPLPGENRAFTAG